LLISRLLSIDRVLVRGCYWQATSDRPRVSWIPTTSLRHRREESGVPPDREPTYEVVWPLSAKHGTDDALPARLDTLDGKVVAELWDYLYDGDRAYPLLREELTRRFPSARFVEYRAFGNIHGPDELEVVARLPEALAEHGVDAVICGVGH
jgi:hypothetical protein